MSGPRVLAIVVHYRNAGTTARCLASIGRQTPVVPDVVVVEQSQGNVDGEAVQAALSSVHAGRAEGWSVIPLRANTGFAGGSNVGLQRAMAQGGLEYTYVWL